MSKNLKVNMERLLPWESAEDYETLYADLNEEHTPQGPTERHLVEELAGIIWRKKRVSMAEGALHRRGLHHTGDDTAKRAVSHIHDQVGSVEIKEAISATPEETAEELKGAGNDQAKTNQALELADAGKYQEALSTLRDDTREWWEDCLEEGEDGKGRSIEATAGSLVFWIRWEALPWINKIALGIKHREDIRSQALGESLDPNKMGELAKHEAFLDRKLENTLVLLMKLQKGRRSQAA